MPDPTTPPTTPPTAVESARFGVGADRVWAYRLDFTNLPEYNPDVSGVARLEDGSGPGGAAGAGARYRFDLAEARHPDRSHPVELWTVEAIEPTLVAAGMNGGNEAYEEFVVSPVGADACEATLTLWVTLPEGLAPEHVAAAVEMGRVQIRQELDLMRDVLEARSGPSS